MSITFSVDEVYEMAGQIERNGVKFYSKAAESATGENQDMLVRLAKMEEEHEQTFADMRAQLPADQRLLASFDPQGQSVLYLQVMADGKVFDKDPSKDLSGSESLEDILETAIRMEEDSIVFYESMKDVVPKKGGAEFLDSIIQQEIGHIVDLTMKLRSIKA